MFYELDLPDALLIKNLENKILTFTENYGFFDSFDKCIEISVK